MRRIDKDYEAAASTATEGENNPNDKTAALVNTAMLGSQTHDVKYRIRIKTGRALVICQRVGQPSG